MMLPIPTSRTGVGLQTPGPHGGAPAADSLAVLDSSEPSSPNVNVTVLPDSWAQCSLTQGARGQRGASACVTAMLGLEDTANNCVFKQQEAVPALRMLQKQLINSGIEQPETASQAMAGVATLEHSLRIHLRRQQLQQ